MADTRGSVGFPYVNPTYYYKKYLAASAKLTKARLDTAAEWFLALLQAKRQENEVMLLFAAVTDLYWLLQRFMEAHPYSPWRDRAEAALARIQETIGL